jgi:hypothetical protein
LPRLVSCQNPIKIKNQTSKVKMTGQNAKNL